MAIDDHIAIPPTSAGKRSGDNMNFTEFLVRALAQTEPWVQACVVLGIAGLTIVQFAWNLWERRQMARIRRERDEFSFKHEHCERQLAVAEKKWERDLGEKIQQFAELKAHADRDRETIRSAIPAFEHVTRQNEALRELSETGQGQIRQLEAELADYQRVAQAHEELREEFADTRSRAERLQTELAAFRKRSDELQQVDADIWIAAGPNGGKPPPFVYREQRRARFVTFLNLKGGVGKTTIAVNLAAAYATGVLGKKLKVLAVDLDLQGTLGNLCVEGQLLNNHRATGRTADRLLDEASIARGVDLLTDLVLPMTGTDGMAHVIVANERLDQLDFRQQAVYAMQQAEVRFCHRQFFHQPFVMGDYDLVFFDCPPRLTTSSINALAASDWIVIPTALDPNDVEAVPRTVAVAPKDCKPKRASIFTPIWAEWSSTAPFAHGGTLEDADFIRGKHPAQFEVVETRCFHLRSHGRSDPSRMSIKHDNKVRPRRRLKKSHTVRATPAMSFTSDVARRALSADCSLEASGTLAKRGCDSCQPKRKRAPSLTRGAYAFGLEFGAVSELHHLAFGGLTNHESSPTRVRGRSAAGAAAAPAQMRAVAKVPRGLAKNSPLRICFPANRRPMPPRSSSRCWPAATSYRLRDRSSESA